jgi:hypothetical protein
MGIALLLGHGGVLYRNEMDGPVQR